MKPFDIALKTSLLRPSGWATRYAVVPSLLALGWIAAIVTLGSSDVLVWTLAHAGSLAVLAGAALALWIVPGMALLSVLWRDHPLSLIERIGVAWGVGAALPPILLLLADLVNLPWNRITTLAYVFLTAGIWLVTTWRRVKSPERELRRSSTPERVPAGYIGALMIGLLTLALIARLYTTREMLVGAYVDSHHHTLITQLLVEHLGLFRSWQPYAPLTTFTYHFGFHANAALYHWLTGMSVQRAILDVGQTMNAATLIAVYALTARLSRNAIAGVWAALIVGFYNTTPAMLSFWGRYTSLTSNLILAILLIVWMNAIDPPRPNPALLGLAAIVSAGLSLTHYQTALIAAVMIAAYLIALRLRSPMLVIAETFGRSLIIVICAALLTAPWWAGVISGHLDRNVVHTLQTKPADEVLRTSAIPHTTPIFLKGPIIALACTGLLIALRRRDWRSALPAGWTLAALATAVPHAFGLPGTGIIETSFVSFMFYLIVTPLAGVSLAAITDALKRVTPRLTLALITGIVIFVSAWGVGWQRNLVSAYVRMVTPADVQAMEWVRAHTPPDARFIVNSHPIYGGDMIVGTDAGWWLPFFTGRQTNVPPMTYGSELSADPQYASEINALARDLRRRPLTDVRPVLIDLTLPETIDRLRTAGYTHIYIGAQLIAGPLGIPAPDRIDTARLRESPHFRLVYDRDGVEIFELVTQ